MARTPMPQLSRYLLRGKLHHPACLHLRPLSSRRFLVSSAVRLDVETAPSSAPNPVLQERAVPLIKQLRDQAKAQKAVGKKSNSDRQTVPGWELTVGIEIHAQLNTSHKLFSAVRPPLPSDQPNTHTALFDLAFPGSQPVFHPEALLPAIRAALAFKCKVQKTSRWDRKHYFWWDQPNGYQITQYYQPFAKRGYLDLYERDGISSEDGEHVKVGIQQIQMEQDTGKTLAGPAGTQSVDFNRVGVPLIEIISQPDIHHPRTAAAFVRKVQTYLRTVDACTSGMEAGGLRADVNVSVRRTADAGKEPPPLGQRTEIKNLSSFKAVEDAIIAERDRQIAVLEQGGTVLGETRGWTLGGTETTRLRGKEGEVDYRYMPDPDLEPLIIQNDLITKLRGDVKMLPDEEYNLLCSKWGLKGDDAMTLMQTNKLEYFYNVAVLLNSRYAGATDEDCLGLAANWVVHELGRLTSERNVSAEGSAGVLDISPDGTSTRVPATDLAVIIYFLYENKITQSVAKELLFSVFRGDLVSKGYGNVEEAIEGENLWRRQLSESEHEDLAASVLVDEEETLERKFRPHFVEQKAYPEGQLMRFVGKMMRAAPVGQVDPQMATQALRRTIHARFAKSWW